MSGIRCIRKLIRGGAKPGACAIFNFGHNLAALVTPSALRFISNYVALDGKFSSSAGMTTYLPTRPGRGVGPPTTYLPRGGDIQVGGRPIVGSAMVPEQLPDLGSSQILARLEPKPCALRTPSLGLRRLAWWLSCM